MKKHLQLDAKTLQIIAWGLGIITTTLSFVVWAQYLDWNFSRLGAYRLFPLFGLVAFGLMWGHYIVAALRGLSGLPSAVSARYFELTSIVVLVLILMHPGLLIVQLWSDGFGLPPDSYLENYVAPSLAWAAMLGTLSLIVFLLFELRHWFSDKSWWKFIGYASDVAMFAIIIHGFQLGTHLQSGWFQTIWIFYTISLLTSIAVIYWLRLNGGKKTS